SETRGYEKKRYLAIIDQKKHKSWKECCNLTNASNPWNVVYKVASGKLGRSSTLTTIKKPDGTYTNNLKETVECMVSHFVAKDNPDTDDNTHKEIRNKLKEDIQTKDDKKFTRNDIEDIIKNLDSKKAPGEDGIDSSIYLQLFYKLPHFTTTIFNECLKRGVFQEIRKRTIIVPIAKPGKEESDDPSKFRPIRLNTMYLEENVSKGCPQGSCCGPGFWNIHYNSLLEIPFAKQTEVVAFADDHIILTKGGNLTEAENYANQATYKISKWAKAHKMKFNEEKSNVLVVSNKRSTRKKVEIYLDEQILEQVKEIKYLGIIIDVKFSFDNHVTYIAAKCAKLVASLSRSARVNWGLKHEVIKTIYKGAIKKLERLKRIINIRISKSCRTLSYEASCIVAAETPIIIKLKEIARTYEMIKRKKDIKEISYDAPTNVQSWIHPADVPNIQDKQEGELYEFGVYTDGSKRGGKAEALAIYKALENLEEIRDIPEDKRTVDKNNGAFGKLMESQLLVSSSTCRHNWLRVSTPGSEGGNSTSRRERCVYQCTKSKQNQLIDVLSHHSAEERTGHDADDMEKFLFPGAPTLRNRCTKSHALNDADVTESKVTDEDVRVNEHHPENGFSNEKVDEANPVEDPVASTTRTNEQLISQASQS
ncbi:hypothetical protein ILUMI_04013, partial [Ignelater luminosus]